jgi:hypothetical protein
MTTLMPGAEVPTQSSMRLGCTMTGTEVTSGLLVPPGTAAQLAEVFLGDR